MTIERHADRTFVARDDAGQLIAMIGFRALLALVAVRHGAASMVSRRRQAYGIVDYCIEPACELYGVGHHTLWELQRSDWGRQLVTKPTEPGPLALTELGEQVLNAIAALPDVRLPEVIAA